MRFLQHSASLKGAFTNHFLGFAPRLEHHITDAAIAFAILVVEPMLHFLQKMPQIAKMFFLFPIFLRNHMNLGGRRFFPGSQNVMENFGSDGSFPFRIFGWKISGTDQPFNSRSIFSWGGKCSLTYLIKKDDRRKPQNGRIFWGTDGRFAEQKTEGQLGWDGKKTLPGNGHTYIDIWYIYI